MNCLVSGGAGFIGSVLVPQLLAAGHSVTVLDNFMYNQTTLVDCCASKKFNIIRGDVTNGDDLEKACKGMDIIIPLACLTGAPICKQNEKLARDVILESIIEFVTFYNRTNMRIIYPTTNSGYGIGTEKACTEKDPLKPISVYGQLKCRAEEYLQEHTQCISLRLATAFGLSPRMRLDLLVNDFVYRAVNDQFIALFEGHFRRNFIHVQDIVGAILHCINNWNKMYTKNPGTWTDNVYNVGLSSANITKLELAQKIQEHIPDFHIGESPSHEDPDKRDYIVSNIKLEKTGWKPKVTLDAGIEELIKGYQIIKRREFSNV